MRRHLAAPPERVFRAFTDRRQLVKWWGPEGFTIPYCRMTVKPGGAWRTCMRSPDGADHWVGGVYREIDKPRRLVFTWAWEVDGKRGHETLVTLELRPAKGGTNLSLTQQAFESAKARGSHKWGWASTFKSLAAFLA
jgi:uncharacterized protein YndB with AHSA1/START domain